jgi:hypothetical protein
MEPKGTNLPSSAGRNAALQESFGGILQMHTDPDITNTMEPRTRDKMENMSRTHQKLTGDLQVYVTHYWEENCMA